VDFTAGRLARWLRLCGFDTAFSLTQDAGGLISWARREGRLVLSRSSKLKLKFPKDVFLLSDDHLEFQLRQVLGELGLWRAFSPFTRCPLCNSPIQSIEKGTAEGVVPPYVFQTQDEFGYCPSCRHYYWKATHWEAIRRRIDQIAQPKLEENARTMNDGP